MPTITSATESANYLTGQSLAVAFSQRYWPPLALRQGLAMTLYTALWLGKRWQTQVQEPEPNYQDAYFRGAQAVPIFGRVAIPPCPQGTIVATYGITGSLEDQWYLKILGRKAFAQGRAVVLFDWRAHGQTAQLSPTLTSDGLYEGEDFVRIAAQAKALGCPPPFWFVGYSLGGQLALWGVKAAQDLSPTSRALGLYPEDLGGAAVVCPSLDSQRSLQYLMRHPLGRYVERAIARSLHRLAEDLATAHPGMLDPAAIARAQSIWGFDQELVIPRLGFASVEDYYAASSPLPFLPHVQLPTLILYAVDDPLFDPTIVPDLQAVCDRNPALHLCLTRYGGHVGYLSSRASQQVSGDRDPWWAWNRVLEWCHFQ
ncbi:YheT family hydrolase [Trichothermofontia sp.]